MTGTLDARGGIRLAKRADRTFAALRFTGLGSHACVAWHTPGQDRVAQNVCQAQSANRNTIVAYASERATGGGGRGEKIGKNNVG